MKKIKSIYVREIGRKEHITNNTYGSSGVKAMTHPITYNSKTNTYHQGNTEYKGEHIISVTYE